MPNQKEVKVTYNRWVLVIPLLLIVVGAVFFNISWAVNPILGLLSGGIVFIGIITMGYLLIMIISLEVAIRKAKQHPRHHPLFSEEMGQDAPSDESSTGDNKDQ